MGTPTEGSEEERGSSLDDGLGRERRERANIEGWARAAGLGWAGQSGVWAVVWLSGCLAVWLGSMGGGQQQWAA